MARQNLELCNIKEEELSCLISQICLREHCLGYSEKRYLPGQESKYTRVIVPTEATANVQLVAFSQVL